MANGTTSEELKAKAIKAAHDAMEKYADSNLHGFVTEATHALEMGAKSSLAKVNPVLIADPRFFESQLYLAGHPVSRTKGERRIRTISCREALDRVALLIPTLRVTDVDRLISARDGATHFLMEDQAAAEALVIPFLATFQLLQQQLGLSDADVFGSYVDLVAQVREKHSKAVDRRVAAKLARARHTFEERYGHLDDTALKAVLQAIEANISLDGYDEQTIECPACTSTGVISGQHEFQRWEPDDFDEDGTPQHAYPIVTLWASEFKCPTCDLHVEFDELGAAGLETELDVENAQTDDFVDPDDDYDPGDWYDRDGPEDK